MKSIIFEDIDYKEYALNGDESNVIRIATSDFGIIDRLIKAEGKIAKIQSEINEDKTFDISIFSELDTKARAIVNEVFDEDVCTKAFGNKNALSLTSRGKPVISGFLEALLDIVKQDFSSMIDKQSDEIKGKTDKYISAVESPKVTVPYNVIQPNSAVPDLSGLTQEQKTALLSQLL